MSLPFCLGKVRYLTLFLCSSDCATVEQKKLQSKLTDLFELADSNKDGVLSDSELETLFTEIVKEYPQLQFYS